jgi:hypothetical protein
LYGPAFDESRRLSLQFLIGRCTRRFGALRASSLMRLWTYQR